MKNFSTNFLTSDTRIKRSTLQRVNSIELQFMLKKIKLLEPKNVNVVQNF